MPRTRRGLQRALTAAYFAATLAVILDQVETHHSNRVMLISGIFIGIPSVISVTWSLRNSYIEHRTRRR